MRAFSEHVTWNIHVLVLLPVRLGELLPEEVAEEGAGLDRCQYCQNSNVNQWSTYLLLFQVEEAVVVVGEEACFIEGC